MSAHRANAYGYADQSGMQPRRAVWWTPESNFPMAVDESKDGENDDDNSTNTIVATIVIARPSMTAPKASTTNGTRPTMRPSGETPKLPLTRWTTRCYARSPT